MLFKILTSCRCHIAKRSCRSYATRNVLKLKDRGLLAEIFPEQYAGEILDLVNGGSHGVYAGFDPTASSLHIGNLLVLMKLMHWQRAGQKPIALIGGATAQIGDPSGKNTERPILPESDVSCNAEEITRMIKNIFENHEKYFLNDMKSEIHPVKIVNNLQWYGDMKALEFVGAIGRNFRLHSMLSKKSVKSRMDSGYGISFTEFTYQMFQAYDWLRLFKDFDCRFQIGGSDQLGNINAGHDLVKKVTGERVYGLTIPLAKTEEGNKFGKSTDFPTVWLSEKFTSPFQLYQYFVRTKDNNVEEMLLKYTFEKIENIKELMALHKKNPDERQAQKILAKNVTLLVHGEKGLELAERLSSIFYQNNFEALKNLNIDEFEKYCDKEMLSKLLLTPGITVVEAAVKAGVFPTEADAVNMISSGAFSINMAKVKNPQEVINTSSHILPNNLSLMRLGRKHYTIVKWTT